MTPTPQERTELQRALELARWIVNTQPHDCTQAERGLAPALISLAAESEELRALLNQETNSAVGSELATSKMWRRRALDAENRADQADADCLALGAELKQWREGFADTTIEQDRRYEALESRYSALVTALKQIAALEDGYVEDSKEAAQILTIIGNIVQDALAAALTPKEGE